MAPAGDDVEVNTQNLIETVAPTITFTLEVLPLIRESQQQHGLRHGDFQRYRAYCARRLRRLRKSINFTQGTKNRYTPKKFPIDKVTDIRFLYLPLVCAERCWSHAMQLKSEANSEPRKKYHMLSRLYKAVHYADMLAEVCEREYCDARTKLEAQAYREWMQGTLQYERRQWHLAAELLTKAKTIYERLGGALAEDAALVYRQKVDELEPSLRYCAYNIGDTTAASDLVKMRRRAAGQGDSALDALIAQTREKQASTFAEVTWQGRVLPVKNEKVRVFLLGVHECEAEVEAAADLDGKLAVYERLNKDCVEALQIVKEELKNDAAFRLIQRGQKVEGRLSNQVFLHTYLSYIRLTKTVERNALIATSLKQVIESGATVADASATVATAGAGGKKAAKPQDVARLYDMILQSLEDVTKLPGLEEDTTIHEAIACDVQFYKACRCYYLALSYSQGKQWPEVVALCNRAAKCASDAADQYSRQLSAGSKASQQKQLEKRADDVKVLLAQIDKVKLQLQASTILESAVGNLQDSKDLAVAAKQPLLERLNDYVDDPKLATAARPNLVNFPPDFEPVPCKPVFFDLALNHVAFPSLEHKVVQAPSQQGQKAGISGFVKSWIGGWGGAKK